MRLLLPALLATGLAACASRDHHMSAAVDALMRDHAGDVPGASVLVVRDGDVVLQRAWGLADVERRVPATANTNYRLASVTKQFTAAAILLLAEDGRLSLDDRVGRWLPSLSGAPGDATLRQLLTHTGGLVDYEDLIAPDASVPLRDADVLRLLERAPGTYFPPGSAYRYSNSGYALLALVVERASRERFASFLHRRIFAPLGMDATVAHEEGITTVANRAYGYSAVARGWARTDQSLTSAVLGDGGIYSSIADLAKWDAALGDERLLRRASLAAAFTPSTPTDAPGTAYGFGWRITGDTVWHSGETIGFRNVIVRWPKLRLTVVVLTNRNEPEPYRTALAIGSLYARGEVERR